MRKRFRPGHYLVEDEESGLTVWDDEVTKTWDGQLVRKWWADDRHPQTTTPPLPRNDQPRLIRADDPVTAPSFDTHVILALEASSSTAFLVEEGAGVILTEVSVEVGSYSTVVRGTNVTAPWGAASHLWDQTP